MNIEDIQITFVGMDPTDALKKYVVEKIEKHKHLWEDATSIEVFLKDTVYSRGVEHDFRIDINVFLPNSAVRVEESGPDMYANIDEASDTLARRLKRYIDKKSYWEGATPWKVLEANAQLRRPVEVVDDYSDYVPSISVRKKIEDMSPLEEGEAIEKMELLGYDQLLFRSKKTGKISMIYRRYTGDYGLVEPADNGIL
ncbi:MAG: ribosome-associated translation inhibitor RaiA [Candidatus Dojkabacteria bacterium]|jgi:putative sigma-54 modulation protein